MAARTRRNTHILAGGWETILEQAPTAEERKNAEGYRMLFFAGAAYLWDFYCDLDNESQVALFAESIDAELDEYRREIAAAFVKRHGARHR